MTTTRPLDHCPFPPKEEQRDRYIDLSPRRRLARRQVNRLRRQQYSRVLRGLEAGQCLFATFASSGAPCTDLAGVEKLRNTVLKSLRGRWRGVQIYTVIENKMSVGWHFHVLIRGADGLKLPILQGITDRILPEFSVDLKAVCPTDHDRRRVAQYVTKQIGHPDLVAAAGPYWHQYSASHHWGEGWVSRAAWRVLRTTWGIAKGTVSSVSRGPLLLARRC